MTPGCERRSARRNLTPHVRLIVLGLISIAIGGGLAARDSSAQSGSAVPEGVPAPFYRMRLVPTMDHEGFGQPVEVFRLLVPSYWRANGWVRWEPNLNCPANILDVGFQSSSPDGLMGFEIFRPYTWQWTDDPMMQQTLMQAQGTMWETCPLSRPVSASDFLATTLIPQRRPGAQILGVEPLPTVAQAEATRLQAMLGPAIQAGLVSHIHVDGARVRIAYRINNQPVEEWVAGTVTTVTQPAFSATAASQGQLTQTLSYAITVSNLTATRAPQGQLDQQLKLFATIISSLRLNQAWVNAVSQTQTALANTQIKGAVDRSKIWADASRDISNIYNQAYQNQQAVQDRLAQQYSQYIRGVETYVDPLTHEHFEFAAGYQAAWVNNRGEYLLSDSPGFNPAVEFREDWRQLQKSR